MSVSNHLEVIEQKSKIRTKALPLLFVHGAWHNAECWRENFFPYFSELGYDCYAMSLSGHGESGNKKKTVRRLRIKDYVDDVVQVVNQFSKPPILVGHSMGGFVLQKYLETHSSPAAILLATVPVNGAFRSALRIIKRFPMPFLKINFKFSLYEIVKTPELAAKILFSENYPFDNVVKHHKMIEEEAFLAYLDLLGLNLPKPKKNKTKMLILGAEQDSLFTPKEIIKTAKVYQAESTIFPNMGHNMMLETHWQQVAETMMAWLRQQQLAPVVKVPEAAPMGTV